MFPCVAALFWSINAMTLAKDGAAADVPPMHTVLPWSWIK
jgi:hypothetical protein